MRLEEIEEGERLLAQAQQGTVIEAWDALEWWLNEKAPALLAAAKAAASERARADKAEAELAEAKQAALATFREWLAENGLVVVPREATASMVMHASLVEVDDIELTPSEYRAAWQAMIAAAPDSGLE